MNKGLAKTSISDDAEGQAKKNDDARAKAAHAARREEERELVDAARGGDRAAFRQLFDRYHRRAYAVALGVVKNPDDALDIVQDAFIKAHRHLGGFQGNSSFYTWLYRIVMNLAIDLLRKKKRARHVDFGETLENTAGDHVAGDASLLPKILGQNPAKALARKQARDQIAEALSELSDNHRTVLVLREVEGLSYEEMSAVMGCSKGTIMSRLFHARKNMQRRLLEMMGGDKELAT